MNVKYLACTILCAITSRSHLKSWLFFSYDLFIEPCDLHVSLRVWHVFLAELLETWMFRFFTLYQGQARVYGHVSLFFGTCPHPSRQGPWFSQGHSDPILDQIPNPKEANQKYGQRLSTYIPHCRFCHKALSKLGSFLRFFQKWHLQSQRRL